MPEEDKTNILKAILAILPGDVDNAHLNRLHMDDPNLDTIFIDKAKKFTMKAYGCVITAICNALNNLGLTQKNSNKIWTLPELNKFLQDIKVINLNGDLIVENFNDAKMGVFYIT